MAPPEYRVYQFDRELQSAVPPKRKGLQLALEPLNGQGIAGYVPEPELWARSLFGDRAPGRTLTCCKRARCAR